MGIDIQLVMPPPFQCYYTVPIEISIKATRVLNDGIAEYVARKPDRFVGLGSVPMTDGKEAVAELDRLMRTLGLKGVQVLTNIAGRELSDPDFAPFWAKAEELGALVVIHPNGFTEGERLTRFYFNNIVGNPFETTLALHYLIFDGVLDRHPDLNLLAVHGGGYLGAYSGRIDHAWGARPDCRAGLPHPPSHYLRKVFVDSVVFTPHQLVALIDVFGADHVLIGTDYPYDMAESDPLGHLAGAQGRSKQKALRPWPVVMPRNCLVFSCSTSFASSAHRRRELFAPLPSAIPPTPGTPQRQRHRLAQPSFQAGWLARYRAEDHRSAKRSWA